MKKIISILFIFNLVCYSQNFKKEIFIDVNNDTINSEVFLKKLKRINLGYSVFESDSINTLKLVKSNKKTDFFEHYMVGKIDSLKRINILSELKYLTNIKIDSLDIIVINFYIVDKNVNQKPCIDHYSSDIKYRNFFKKNKNVKQFTLTNQSYFYDKNDTHRDKNKIIEDLLFPNVEYCGNYIIIFPDNNYILKYSEYRQEVILELIKDYKKR